MEVYNLAKGVISAAGTIISRLKAQGTSFNEVARQLGRDSSLISQIARGKKVGANLLAALEQIERKEAPTAPERRRAASGEFAKVRQPLKPAEVKPVKTTGGLPRVTRPYVKPTALMEQLRKIARADGNVVVYVKVTGYFEVEVESDNRYGVAIKRVEGGVKLWSKGGRNASHLVDEIEASGMNAYDYLLDVAVENGLNLFSDNEDVSPGIPKVQLIASYPQRRV